MSASRFLGDMQMGDWKKLKWSVALVILIALSGAGTLSQANANSCFADPIVGGLKIGEVYEINAKMKVDTYASYHFTPGKYMSFDGIEIVKKPPGSLVVKNDHEIGGSISKIGTYEGIILVKMKYFDQQGSFKVIMHIEVVPEC